MKYKGYCKHKWKPVNSIVLTNDGKEYPRLVLYCSRCQTAKHIQVYSPKQMEDLDE